MIAISQRRRYGMASPGVLVSFGLMASLLLISAAVSYQNSRQLYESALRVSQCYETQTALDEVLSAMKDVEIGQRGYVITGEKAFLKPFTAAVASLPEKMKRLRDLIGDKSSQQAHFASLQKKIEQRLEYSRKSNDLREHQGFKPALEMVLSNKGKEVMDEIRGQVEEMLLEERRALKASEHHGAESYRLALAGGIVTALMTVGIIGLVLYRVRRQLAARQHVAEVLHEERERLRVSLTSIGDAVILTDAQGIVTFLNPAAESLLGWTQQAKGKPLSEVCHLVNETTRQPLEMVFREGRIIGLAEYTLLIGRDGRETQIDESIAPIRDRQGNIEGIVLVLRDMTERRRAIKELELSEARYRSVVDHVVHGVIIIDEAGIIESVNPAAQKIFGFPAAELVGQNVKLLMPEPFRSEHDRYLDAYLRTGEAKIIGIGREVVGRRKDGSTFPVDLAVSTFRLGGRRLFTGIIRDATMRKRVEQELRQRADQLTDADRRKNEFLAMLAHELRNPLAPIHNALHLLRQKCPSDDETVWAHDVIDRQVQHMARMVDDLLDVSRITRGKINLRKEPMDVAGAVTSAVEMVQPLIDARQHKLTIALPPEAVWVEGDLARLAQVLANLLNNAAKYTEDGGHIWLEVERQKEEAVLKVRDTGVGIPAEYLPRVFDLFSQEDRALDRAQSGLGIGLTLARILVQIHGGNIQAFSAGAGKGSEFVVRLPALPANQPAPSRSLVEKPTRAQTPRRILVVDDNVDGARTLSRLLAAAGHEVRTAHDGVVALETARHWAPDAVLLDIGLPRMNGLEVARKMRDELGLTDALLVAMTGYGQDEDRQRSLRAGFDAHLVKPLDLDVLRDLLAR